MLTLHREIMLAAQTTIQKAIRLGELLTAQKTSLKHGEWLPWLEANVPFDRATAANYMRVFERRAELNVKGVLHLTDAYRLLAAPWGSESSKQDWRAEWQGMPEFVSKDQSPYRTIKVHFSNEVEVEEFFKLVGARHTLKTKYIWFKPKPKRSTKDFRYVDIE